MHPGRARKHLLLGFAAVSCATTAPDFAKEPTLGAFGAARAAETGPSTPPLPGPNTGADAGASAGGAALDGSSPAAAPTDSPAVSVGFEPPYAPGHRPRPSGELAAAGDDELVARWNLGGNGDPSYAPNLPSFHPGTRVVVETHVVYPRLPSGTPGKKAKGLTAQRVLAQARSRGYWPFRICYETGLREDGPLSGETRLRFTIGPRGRVVAARLLRSELRSKSVAACVVKRARSLHFDPPPARKVDVDLSVEFWPGDAPLPNGPAAGPNLDAATLRGIAGALESKRARIEDCYRAGVAKDAALWGRAALSCEVDAAGKAIKVEERESRFPDPHVSGCLRSVVSELEFPEGARGKTVVVALRLGELPIHEDAGLSKPESD